ncbi:hypothetical protein Lysil_0221 [Lysobacter silvestris]|uniref:DUF1800 domain-containing protein n=2 Tax=Solilutibacter silvestris TaxID=1645665 RepID=A0A2K1Q0L3_9GAMM|nr:hypothetical protein Lysil_0221 [Lysobacter silvestris]
MAFPSRSHMVPVAALGMLVAGIAQAAETPVQRLQLGNRISWGIDSRTLQRVSTVGVDRYLDEQLRPDPAAPLPPAIQAQIDAMQISRTPMPQLVRQLEAQRKAMDPIHDEQQKKALQDAYQKALNAPMREAATRSLLRDLYSPKQLQEQMTWFWMNHFSVFSYKANIRPMLADYEDAVRAHALGRFRDLLGAVAHHPAMLRDLDNDQNAAGHINENYARELMELHTLGVNGGYSQKDVQEVARVLTGLGVNQGDAMPKIKPALQAQYRRAGLFEFNPGRHDYGPKVVLGAPIRSSGLAETDEVLDRLARQPATAHFISRKLAIYFIGDGVSDALVERLAQAYLHSDGQIAVVLKQLFRSDEFHASLGRDFKDPIHYVVSAVRLAYEDKPILNAGPMLGWLGRMGEPLYGRQTPDGYPLGQAAWVSSGQMNTRFEIAKAIGSGSAGLFKLDQPNATDAPAFPQLQNALYYQAWQPALSAPTRDALTQARSPQEWNTYFLASPDFMNR